MCTAPKTLHKPKPQKDLTTSTTTKPHNSWAEDRGATHFCHWFQPLTNYFAYKHDSLIKHDGDHVITNLTGKMLVIGEPDGSSFPSGGLRATHTARGYTVWDPSSPCFITSHGTGTTLNIPSVFFSWTGHALDEKTPLLRSVEAFERETKRLLKVMGEAKHKRVHADSGIEQEFFLIDKDYYRARPDIMQTGRTLTGADPPKGQSLDDQYFGSFSDRSLRMMNDAEVAMWKLGIPQTTRHREVAPGQYEMAPVFSTVNVSGDFNLLQMDILSKTAEEHDLAVLFHEKPFAGLNGSGKHNNWSVGTDRVPSLFSPGDKPEENLLFMTFLAATIRAVDLHGDVMRYAVAGPGNDHRLGANEAPPAIVSIYLGDDVTRGVYKFIGEEPPVEIHPHSLGVSSLPEFTVDRTDRNRTSPFAFTGNKFEFRAVGSSHNPSRSNTCLNVMAADSVAFLADEIAARTEGKNLSKSELRDVVVDLLQSTIKKHMRVLFDGDNYSEDWVVEAEKRGLLNLRTTPEAYATFNSQKNTELFGKYKVLSKEELDARIEVALEEYNLRVSTEVSSFGSLVNTHIMPPAYNAQTRIAGSILAAVNATGGTASEAQVAQLRTLSGHIDGLASATAKLGELMAAVPHGDAQDEADYLCNVVLPVMAEGRSHADALELLCSADDWILPTYHEMLFHQS